MAKDLISSIQELSLKPSFILLVGGSSKTPAVGSALKQATGLECRTFDEAEEAVSLGAALYAHMLWGCPETSPTQEASPEIPSQPSEPPQPTSEPLPVSPQPQIFTYTMAGSLVSEPSPVSPQPQAEPIPQPEPQPIPWSLPEPAVSSPPNLSPQPKPAPKTQPSSPKSGRWKVFGFLLLAGFLFFLISGGIGDLLPWFFQLVVALFGAGYIIENPKHAPIVIFLIIKKFCLG